MNESELVRRARDGDENAFRVLYDDNVDRVYRLTYRMAGRDDLARDFTQETFLRAYRKLGQFRGDAAFSTWLHSIAVSVSLNGLRKVDRHRRRERDIEDAAHLGSSAPSVAPWLRERLKEAIDGLPDIYRTVFLMHDLEGFNHKEIAAALDVAEGTSKARLSRARAKLRESLGDVAREHVG
ncbi:MAG TPA: sigma-70 family RNA polymerase sigma factor [Longimicrobiales bacterium]|nr:sigma-70 family RNA polymerase sigma factor [Longimicrobiales bacterium]